MADWPLYGPVAYKSAVDGTISRGVAVTSSATVNNKGAWTELIASTPHASNGFYLNVRTTNSTSGCIDIGIGPAGAEIVVVPNLWVGTQNVVQGHVWVPIALPRGVRVAARVQSGAASKTFHLALAIASQNYRAPRGLQGAFSAGVATTATTTSTGIDPGLTANSKGGWTELIASTDRVTRWIVLSLHWAGVARVAETNWLVDVGMGPIGAEQVVVPDIAIVARDANSSNSSSITPLLVSMPAYIPLGSRIAVRAQCDATSNDRNFGVGLVGLF